MFLFVIAAIMSLINGKKNTFAAEYNKVKIYQLELNFNIDPKVFVDNFLSRYNKQISSKRI